MKNKKDSLGDRQKSFYEDAYRFKLPRNTYTLLRCDGKSFHSYTKGLIRPFDEQLVIDMDEAAAYACNNIQGAVFAYVQSDEISILITDFEDSRKVKTISGKNDNRYPDAWFGNLLQKMCSVSASLVTAKFNQLRPGKIATFDSRIWQIPKKVEVENYLIFRQNDATRNSISSVAQSLYSPKELHGKNSGVMQEMIFQKGINWNDYNPKYKRGRIIEKVPYMVGESQRSKWESVECPIFTQERDWLSSRIPE